MAGMSLPQPGAWLLSIAILAGRAISNTEKLQRLAGFQPVRRWPMLNGHGGLHL